MTRLPGFISDEFVYEPEGRYRKQGTPVPSTESLVVPAVYCTDMSLDGATYRVCAGKGWMYARRIA